MSRESQAADSGSLEIVRIAPSWDDASHRAICARFEALAASVAREAIVHRGRNLIFLLEVDGREVSVKRFPVRGAWQRAVYRVRTGKAIRSFDNAVRLLELGLGTPAPLAVAELRRGGRLAASFYCCELVVGVKTVKEIKEERMVPSPALLGDLGRFLARVHAAGVRHEDLTAGNILMIPDPAAGGGFSFAFVDVNRMRFGPVGERAGLRNLVQLGLRDEASFLAAYCHERKIPFERSRSYYRLLLVRRKIAWTLKNGTRPLRRKLGL